MAIGRRICVMFLLTITLMLPLLSAAPLDLRVNTAEDVEPRVNANAEDVEPRENTNAEDDLRNGNDENASQQNQRQAKSTFDLSNMNIGNIDFSGSFTFQDGSVGHKLEFNVNEHSHEHHRDGDDHHGVYRVDCQWTDWSSCSVSCGDGYRHRERSVATAAKYGGNPCVGDKVEKEPCNTGPCTGLKNEEQLPCFFEDDQLVPQVGSDGKLTPHDSSAVFQWENNIIPYFFTSTSEKDQKLFRSVMAIIEGETCFKFEEKTKAEYREKHSLEIKTTSRNSCSTSCRGDVAKVYIPYSVGRLRLTSETQVTDKESCEPQCGGFILHELMHALGVGHTMRRSDRDDYITVNEQNLKSLGLSDQFKKCSQCTLYPDVPYDCNSIMHYGTHLNDLEIYKPNDPSTCQLGKKARLTNGPNGSNLDWKLLNNIGKCGEEENGPRIFTECFTSPGFPNQYPSNSDTKQTLTVEDGQEIEITFVHFDVEYQNTCSYDYLRFFDATGNTVGKKMCGESLPQKLTISTSTASAHFYSDGSEQKEGYKFCYKPVKHVCAEGEINSASCFCKSENGDESEVCSVNQGCTEKGACYAVCTPGPYILKADCFCQEKTTRRGKLCTEGFKCGEGGCLNEEAKQSCEFDDDLLTPIVMSDGQMSPHDRSEVFKWNNNVVPYYYKDESTRVEDKDLVRSVMDRIEEKTCFKFEEKKKTEYENKHSLEIVISDFSCSVGCAGSVSVKKAPYSDQKLELYLSAHITDEFGDDCGYKGLLIHELMHALGVGHTQRRKDRDNFIEVKIGNLDGRYKNLIKQYQKCGNCTLYDQIPYDCGSIMHYGTHFNGREVIVPKENCELGRAPLLFSVRDAPEKDYELLNIIGKCGACTGPPPATPYGSWKCDDDLTSCELFCTPGYAPVMQEIECINSQWDLTSSHICAPSLYLLAGGNNAWRNVELYHPTLQISSSAVNTRPETAHCKSPPPQLTEDRKEHTSFIHDSTVYVCGGIKTESTCLSLNNPTASSWTTHTLSSPIGYGLSSIVFGDKVLFVGGLNSGVFLSSTSTSLPLSSSPTLTPVPKLSYKGTGQCVAKLSATSFIISGGWHYPDYFSTVLLYNLKTESVSTLAPLSTPRQYHGCITVQQEGKMWLIVTGGEDHPGFNTLSTTQRLDIEDNTWEEMEDLKEARSKHTMIRSSESKGVVVLGGDDGLKKQLDSVEVLENKEWQRIEPSLVIPRSYFGGAVEVSADLFSCQLDKPVCSCSGFINNIGYGECKKSGWRFGEDKFCYVNLPSNCTDLVESELDRGRWASAQPCK